MIFLELLFFSPSDNFFLALQTAPKAADVAFSMLKPFLNDSTISKITFYGTKPEVEF